MADVTFGVKVSEEMKSELSEMMKTTSLTGKEFMQMLVSSYKLEQSKQKETLIVSDIDQLQKLLQQIQNLYLNVYDKAEVAIEEQNKIYENKKEKQLEEIHKLEQKELGLKEQIDAGKKEESSYKNKIKELREQNELKSKEVEEYKIQLKQTRLLIDKYELELEGLKQTIDQLKRFELEIEERKEENQKLASRNDELASDIWFLQRENEKIKKENDEIKHKYDMNIETLKEKQELSMKNALLEQKLEFSNKINILKESHLESIKEYQQEVEELRAMLADLKNKK